MRHKKSCQSVLHRIQYAFWEIIISALFAELTKNECRKEIDMKVSQQETTLLRELRDQETVCQEKYELYAQQAHDPELKELFQKIGQQEHRHYETLGSMMAGEVSLPKGQKQPEQYAVKKAAYSSTGHSADKKQDEFLATDSIATEKYVSSTYDTDLFHFSQPEMRTMLNHIQTEEQNHAEMIYQYKTANGMS